MGKIIPFPASPEAAGEEPAAEVYVCVSAGELPGTQQLGRGHTPKPNIDPEHPDDNPTWTDTQDDPKPLPAPEQQ